MAKTKEVAMIVVFEQIVAAVRNPATWVGVAVVMILVITNLSPKLVLKLVGSVILIGISFALINLAREGFTSAGIDHTDAFSQMLFLAGVGADISLVAICIANEILSRRRA